MVSAAQEPGSFGEQRGENDPARTWRGEGAGELTELDARLNGGSELAVRLRPIEMKTLDLLNRARRDWRWRTS